MVDADFDRGEPFCARGGGTAVLVGPCVQLLRSFIAIPAGIERMSIVKFSLYTLLGSGVWNAIWIGAGFVFGPAIKPVLEQWSGVLSNAVLAVIVVAVVWFVVKRLRRLSRAARTTQVEQEMADSDL